MKNRGGLFDGWKQVFKFTANQNMKGTGFKVSTIGIALLMFALLIAINCIMANSQLKESKKDKDAVMDLEDTTIEAIYYSSKDEQSKEVIENVIESIKEDVDIEFVVNENEDKVLNSKGDLVMVSYMDENVLKLEFNIGEESSVEEDDVKTFAAQFAAIIDNMRYSMVGLSQVQIAMVNASEYVYTQVVDVDKVNEEVDEGLMIAQMVVPMIYTMVFYFMVLMYAQSIQKLIVTEKTSKLMETLLTSVKPYAVIMGKVLAMAVIGIGQTLLWVLGGVLGYIVGDKIALQIYPEYENYIGMVIDLMQTDSEIAFAPVGIILAIIAMVLGYFVYCLLGGLSGAVVNKIEDMSGAQMFFMIPTMIGFFAAYLGPLMIESDALNTVFRLVPIISPFMLPAELIIGKALMWEGLCSIGILLATCFGLVIFIGKIYKNRVFNRG